VKNFIRELQRYSITIKYINPLKTKQSEWDVQDSRRTDDRIGVGKARDTSFRG